MAKLKTRRERQALYEIDKVLHPYSDFVTPNNWRYMPHGAERRKLILQYLAEHETIAVNNKWQANTHYDPDLKKLIKQGKIIMRKAGGPGKRQTYLRLA